jgi:uncharacterized membrane protein
VTGRVAEGFDAIGAVILSLGFLWSLWLAVRAWRTQGGRAAYQTLRQTFSSSLLLGLEVLVAADLIRTVAVSPTLGNVLVLGLIVLIRTLLSFSLQIEADGVLPWRRGPTPSRSADRLSRSNPSA